MPSIIYIADGEQELIRLDILPPLNVIVKIHHIPNNKI